MSGSACEAAKWKGTPLLTRRRARYGTHRVLAVGDACGYIEPFTGEGITWALESAMLVADFLPHDLGRWEQQWPMRWRATVTRALAREQRLCQVMRFILHRPPWVRGMMLAASVMPSIGEVVARTLDARRRLSIGGAS